MGPSNKIPLREEYCCDDLYRSVTMFARTLGVQTDQHCDAYGVAIPVLERSSVVCRYCFLCGQKFEFVKKDYDEIVEMAKQDGSAYV